MDMAPATLVPYSDPQPLPTCRPPRLQLLPLWLWITFEFRPARSLRLMPCWLPAAFRFPLTRLPFFVSIMISVLWTL